VLHTISGKDTDFVKVKKWKKQKVKTEYPPADVLKGLLSIVEVGVAGGLFLFFLRWRWWN